MYRALLLCSLLALSSVAQAQLSFNQIGADTFELTNTVSGGSPGFVSGENFLAQSFTLPPFPSNVGIGYGHWEIVSFAFLDSAGNPIQPANPISGLNNQVFVFSSPYTGTPGGLGGADPVANGRDGFLGVGADGTHSFDVPGLGLNPGILAPNGQFFIYSTRVFDGVAGFTIPGETGGIAAGETTVANPFPFGPPFFTLGEIAASGAEVFGPLPGGRDIAFTFTLRAVPAPFEGSPFVGLALLGGFVWWRRRVRTAKLKAA